MQEENFPLIPKPTSAENHDIEHILRDVFQDVLEKPKYPRNIAKNLMKNTVECNQVKDGARNVDNIIKKSILSMEDIGIVEEKIMYRQGEYLMLDKRLKNNACLLQTMLYKKQPLMKPIDHSDLLNYGLIQGDDLLPDQFRKTMDFSINENEHKCAPCLPDLNLMPRGMTGAEFLNYTATKSKDVAAVKTLVTSMNWRQHLKPKVTTGAEFSNDTLVKSMKWRRHLKPRDMTGAEFSNDTTTEPKDVAAVKTVVTSTKWRRHLKKQLVNPLRLSTDKVVFCNYGVNKVYKKRFQLQNVSNVTQGFMIASFPKTGYFEVEIEDRQKRISPGLSATFTITFQTDNYLDIQDTIVIHSLTEATELDTNIHATVLLASYRDAPNLFMYVYKNIFPIKHSTSPFDISRSIALNNSIDCGASFLTERMQVYLIVKNNGGDGKFFFMTEENWFDSNINNLHSTLDLEAGCFIVKPAYFEIMADEYLVISIQFGTKTRGVNLEKLVLLCNNATYEKLDVIADGVLFDRFCISLKKENLLPLEHLAYILYVSNDNSIFYADVGEGDVFHSREMSALRNMIDPDFTDYGITGSNNRSSVDVSEINMKTSSEAILAYLKGPRSDLDGEDGDDYEKYLYRYLIFFESVVPFKSSQKTIAISNNCLLDLCYYWKIEGKGSEKLGYDNLKDLDRTCLEISGLSTSYFPSYSTFNFNLILTPDIYTEGFYRLLLSLYIKSVPKCAIDGFRHFITVQYDDTDMVDILIATYDVVCRIPPVVIEFVPREIVVEKSLEFNEVYECTFIGKVSNEDKHHMECCWSIAHGNIHIEPKELTMEDNENVEFSLKVHNMSYYDTTASAVFIVNNVYKKILPICVKANRPTLKFQHDILDLGWLLVGNKYRIKFVILNDNYIGVSWEIWENYGKYLTANNVEISINNLEDSHIEVEYTIDAKEEVEWESNLILYTSFNGEKVLDSVCRLKYNISKLQVCLHTPMSQCPILSPKQVLYINNSYSYILCLHNMSNISTCYYFGNPYGSKSECIDVNIVRSVGHLRANSVVQLNIEITPKTVGVVDEVYVPCYFRTGNPFLLGQEKQIEPIILAILFVAEDIFVRVILPCNKHGIQEDIIWPPQMIYDFDYEYIDYENLAMDENEGETDNKSDVTHTSDLIRRCDVTLEKVMEDEKDHCGIVNDISAYLNSIMYPFIDEGDDECNMRVPNNSQETSELSSDSGLSVISQESLRKYFDNKDFVIQENVIEFLNVPLHKVIRKTITIENCTSITGILNVETVNFNPIDVEKKKIDSILENIKQKQFDAADKMLSGQGIWIKAEPNTATLKPFETIKIEISLYANTWGTYAEELLIEINDILPLCISVLVDVTGLPLQFVNFKNSLQKYPLFRFGRVCYKSDCVDRKIFFKNVSFVPISITWHIFLKTKDVNGQPITLIFDVFHPNLELKLSDHDSMGNLMMMHGKYFGNTEQYIFNIEPKESYINSGDTKYLDISFNPKAYAANFKHKLVEAYLIGYVQIAKQFRCQPNLFIRKSGSNIQYLKMKLTATMELPILTLDLVRGDLNFIYYANNITNGDKKQTKTLCFKNFHNTKANISMSADTPLEIEKMETTDGITTNNSVMVSPGESVEVQISCTINNAFMLSVAEILYNVNYDPDIESHLDCQKCAYGGKKHIHIKQEGIVKQLIPLEIMIYFPNLEMTTELEFGFVFVGNNKKQILSIWNYTTCRVPFTLECTGDLIINPSVGMLEASKHDVPFRIDVSVIFIPRIVKVYLETILLTTNVPGLLRTATVRGIGTHDEKHFRHDLC